MKRLTAFVLMLAAACTPAPEGPEPIRLDFPEVRSFAASSPGRAQRPNSEIALDFVDLAFRMESGRELPLLTRFEQPITVRVAGNAPPTLFSDLEGLLNRLRAEARIDISYTQETDANIVIEAVPSRALQRVAPNAACFVVPRVQSWSELRRARNTPTLDWATLRRREKAAIFLPSDAAPQEIRDCLHEELAQALGPLNDLYRLPDSIFNDDNIHAVLTGFDMLILRTFYAPELQSGMTEGQVAQRLPRILARLNPRGERAGGQIPSSTSRAWINAIETALSDGSSDRRRRQAAARAVAIGQSLGWTGTREGFANYAFGRLQIGNDATLALGAFNAAGRAYGQSPVTNIHSAHIAVQLAAFTLISGDAEATIAITSEAIPVAEQHENAALMSLLMMFRAEALDLQGKTEEGMALRLDSLGWGLYGFGTRQEVIDRLNEIASLPPQIPPS
ncbi:MAG: DUF2927 domain-containing protein [Pseudomonadota bacterium]